MIRRLDARRDLLAVADLIELCFANQMDQEGIDYIRHIRRAARDHSYLRWAPGSHENISIPLDGYVWVDQNRVVGNLTLIPFLTNGKWRYLIANVAVHPDYRQLGIGRSLTEKALEHIRDHMAESAWLQVRDDNPVAIHLYRNLGFMEKSRRSTWNNQHNSTPTPDLPPDVQVTGRRKADWEDQSRWLNATYPPDVSWNLPVRISSYKPDLMHDIVHWMNGDRISHWSARRKNELIGLVTQESGMRGTDNLWIAASPEHEDHAVLSLLAGINNRYSYHHHFTINYPAGKAARAFEAAGFSLQNTLIWMEVRFR
jgi:ribosomal protein S18 acetylase RimI-like enzyme